MPQNQQDRLEGMSVELVATYGQMTVILHLALSFKRTAILRKCSRIFLYFGCYCACSVNEELELQRPLTRISYPHPALFRDQAK